MSQLIKRGKEYCLFLKSVDENLEKEVIVFSDKFVELRALKSREVYYYKLRYKEPCKEYYTGYSILFSFPKKCQKDGVMFSDTANLIALTKNKYDNKTIYAFGESEDDIEQ